MTLGEFAQRCGGQLLNADPSVEISGFETDSRACQPGSLFIAIHGANVDGHDFVATLSSSVASLATSPSGRGRSSLSESHADLSVRPGEGIWNSGYPLPSPLPEGEGAISDVHKSPSLGEGVARHETGAGSVTSPEALGSGGEGAIAASLVERDCGPYPQILVRSVTDALATFALSKRSEFTGPVVGITGSNGKTSAKEFVAAALSPLGPVLKSGGNRNTEYTAPLLWTEGKGDEKSAVAEMGMRGFGQIAHLAGFTQPDVCLITMIGTAHVEMVGSREGIAQAKAEIFEHAKPGAPVVIWREDDFYNDLRMRAEGHPVVTFGFSPDADVRVLGYRAETLEKSVVMLRWKDQTEECVIPTIGRHQSLNAAAAVAVAVQCGVDFADACRAIQNAKLPPLRMEIRHLRGATLLLDNYNASPDSTVAALLTLRELPSNGSKWAILGEMKELGDFSESGHRMVGKALAEFPVEHVVFFGDLTRYMEDEAVGIGFPKGSIQRVADLDELSQILNQVHDGDLVLMKGSRALGMERAL